MLPENSNYPIHQSCLYKLRNRAKLARLLPASLKGLESLADSNGRYACWNEPKKNGGSRRIEAPHDNLKAVQKRITNLLQRIEPPDFLMAPVKGRSYVDNAAAHIGARAFHLLDIEEFFPSCTSKRVYWFFRVRMLCSPDVAALLTKLVTYNGHLPQGSPCSPILAYFTYEDMWGEIREIVTASSCTLSVYADDITISGDVVYEKDIWAVKSCLFRFGFRHSPHKERGLVNRAADVTGVIVKGASLLLPNRQHQKLDHLSRALRRSRSKPEREGLKRQLRGRVAQASQITGHLARMSET
ncbi:reverse transcriptase family protein [Maricaulis sp.]|uniref:reverse transcriptase family protein n=1 Tax=Maricaulis sp. TaxID=1486257 RepID=UPI003A8E3273